jgi:hypothetical protein
MIILQKPAGFEILRAMILLINLIIYNNEEIKEPESLIKAQLLP